MTFKKVRKAISQELSAHVIGAHNISEVLNRIVRRAIEPELVIIDLFCGAGGTSSGFSRLNRALVVACVNHDFMAIKSHWLNHPDVAHFEEDMRTLDLAPLVKLVNYYRKLYPNAKIVLWASLECTNFSKAKGGQPRDADSRTLADHLHRYIIALDPDYVMIENVVEFMSWGPLCENGKPISRKNGSDWLRWRREINDHGYRDEWRELNSADFGAYTSRNRLFGIFAKDGLPIAWPQPTHAKKVKLDMFGNLKPWKAVRDVLDFTNEGVSIFARKTPLSEKTLERIYAGLIKYVAGGKEAFILKYNSTDKNGVHHPPSVDEPSPVISTQNRLGLVQTSFISKYYSGKPEGKVISVDGPAGTVTCVDGQSLVNAQFLHAYYGNGDNNTSVDQPAPTIPTKDRCALVQPQFLDKQYGSGPANHQSLEQPAGSLMPNDKHCLISTEHFITRDFSGGGQHSSIDAPAGAILPFPKLNVVNVQQAAFITPTNFDNQPTSLDDPLGTITANRKWHYLVNPSWGGCPTSTDSPSPVIVARQDKAPLYLVYTEHGEIGIIIYDTDSPTTKLIKEFMALYSIVDIKMRMLMITELLKIQDMGEVKLLGTQAEQKKFIGNAVVPLIPEGMGAALISKLDEGRAIAA